MLIVVTRTQINHFTIDKSCFWQFCAPPPRPLCLSPLPLSAQLPDLPTLLPSRQVPESVSVSMCMWLILCVCACVFGKGFCLWGKWQVMRASWWVSPSSGAPFIAVNKGPFTRRFSNLWTPGKVPLSRTLTEVSCHSLRTTYTNAKLGTQMQN